MAEARNRGTYAERRAAASEKIRANAVWHELQRALRNDVMWRIVFNEPGVTHEGSVDVRGHTIRVKKMANGKVVLNGPQLEAFCKAERVALKEPA